MFARGIAILLACCSLGAAAQGLSKDEYKAQRLRVQDRLATSKDRCTAVSGHSREVCQAEAWAEYDTARAELLARYKPTERNRQKAELVKARSAMRVAVEKCGDLEGAAHRVCEDDAKRVFAETRARTQARRAEQEGDTRLAAKIRSSLP